MARGFDSRAFRRKADGAGRDWGGIGVDDNTDLHAATRVASSLVNLLESARAKGRNQSAGRTESTLEGDRHLELTFRPADADDRHSMKGEFTCLPDDYRLVPTPIS